MAELDYSVYIRTLPGKNRCDLSPLLASPDVLARVLEDLAAPFRNEGITKVAALDALGFALGGGVAQLLGAGLVLVRKGGKVAWHARSTTFTDYSREEKCFEIAENAVTQDDSVLIVDDWSETGAQLRAAIALLESMGSKVIGAALINIEDDLLHNPVLSRYTLHSLLGESW